MDAIVPESASERKGCSTILEHTRRERSSAKRRWTRRIRRLSNAEKKCVKKSGPAEAIVQRNPLTRRVNGPDQASICLFWPYGPPPSLLWASVLFWRCGISCTDHESRTAVCFWVVMARYESANERDLGPNTPTAPPISMRWAVKSVFHRIKSFKRAAASMNET